MLLGSDYNRKLYKASFCKIFMTIGFGNYGEEKKNIYDSFIGKPGMLVIGHLNSLGILKEVNVEEGYLIVQPSIVGFGNDIRIEKNNPTIMLFEKGSQIVLRPLQDGDIEKIVSEGNKKNLKNNNTEENKKIILFK